MAGAGNVSAVDLAARMLDTARVIMEQSTGNTGDIKNPFRSY